MSGRIIVWGLSLVVAVGALGCGARSPRKTVRSPRTAPRSSTGVPRVLFHFDGLENLPDQPYETDPPLAGKAASYKVPLRKLYYSNNVAYSEYGQTIDDPYYGPTDVYGSEYIEEEWPTRFFLERSDDETLPDGNLLLNFAATASRSTVPEDGGSVWVRVKISAPAFVNTRETGLHLVLVLDASESMRDPAKLRLLRSTAGSLITQLLPSDRIALVAFDGGGADVLVESRDADDYAPLLDAIDGLSPGTRGGANLGAGLYEAYRQAQAMVDSNGGLGNVILLSDGVLGGATGGVWRSLDLVRQRHAKGFRLGVIALGEDVEPSLLASLARAGEGRLAFVGDPTDIGKVLAREMGSTLRAFARNVRLRLVSDEARILEVHGDGIRDSRGAKELVLTDFASGEERSVLIRLKIPAMASHTHRDVKFQLFFKQLSPVRRTILEQSLAFHVGRDSDAQDGSVATYARLVTGLEQIRKALEGDHETYVKPVVYSLEKKLPRYKAVALAEGERELIEKAELFEEFATRIRSLEIQGRIGAGEEWNELRRDFYHRYR